MSITSLTELREALRTASPGATIQLAPGEYPGPLVIDTPVTLRGLHRKTVLWRRGGPVIYVRASGVRLDSLLIERTVETQGPLVIHNAGCTPIGKESMQVDSLVNLGELIPGSTLLLPLEIQTAARAEIAVTGLYGARVSPSTLDTPGKHLVWLTLDGNTLLRGEILLGEMTLREGNTTRYLWLSGTVLDNAPPEANYCLAAKKTRLFPSISGLMLDGAQLSVLDGGQALTGRYAFVGRDSLTGALFVHLPGKPPLPVMVNGLALDPLTRVLLHEKDTIKIGGLALTVQPADSLPFDLTPQSLTFADFDEHFPGALALALDTGKSAWKGRAVPTVPWLDVTPTGDLRVPATRSHTWTVQLNSEALALPNGLHEVNGGLMVISSSAVVSVDVRLNVCRPDVLLQVPALDVGALEQGWPVDHTLSVPIGNLGRSAWTGTVRSGVPWLEVVTPMPVTCGAWSEINVDVRFVPAWEQLAVGIHEIPGALVVAGPGGDLPITARIEITPPHGHLTALVDMIAFDEVERNAPLPTAVLPVRNDGGGVWAGTITAVTNWVRANPDQIAVEPGATAEIEVSLLDVPAELALNTPVLIDELQLTDGDSTLTVGVQMTVVELPPYLVASPVNFPPFVKGDNPPEAQLRIYNNGPSRWKGSVTATLPWLTVPQGMFTCEPGDNVPITVTLNGKAPDALKIGFSQWEDALEISGGRARVTATVYVDLREPISDIHLDTPILNFGQFDGASTGELPAQTVRLVNASPAVWKGKVELGAAWLSLRGPARAFDLDVPGMSVAEFAVALNDSARYLLPGMTMEDRAVSISGRDPSSTQELTVRALLVLNEWSPLISVSPEKLTLSDDSTQQIIVRNDGSQHWTLQVHAASWLDVTPAEFTLGAGQSQTLNVCRAIGPFADITGDPRAIVIAGPGRETSVEVEIVAPGG